MPNQIDLTIEDAVTLKSACRLPEMKRDGRPLHVATIHRWATRGVRGTILETVQHGPFRVTTREAIARFFQSLTVDQQRPIPQPRAKARTKQIEFAERELAAAGFELA